MNRQMKKWRAGRSVIGILALTASAGIGVIGLSTSVSSAATPNRHLASNARRAAGSTHNWHNNLNRNTNGWCPVTNPPNSPCDGASGDYGTIGNYPILRRRCVLGRIRCGCHVDWSEKVRTCHWRPGWRRSFPHRVHRPGRTRVAPGPYNLWGPKNQGNDTTFPSGGFTTTIKMYVDAGWGDANTGNVVDWDTGLQTSAAAYEEDFVIDLCSTAIRLGSHAGKMVLVAAALAQAHPTPSMLNTSGWYTLQMNFTNGAGTVYVTYSVLSDGSTGQNTPSQVWSYTENTGIATASSGGPLYGWLPTEDVSGLPLAQVRLAVN